MINGDVAASGDPRMPSSSGATRNGTAQFSKTLGASNYSFSLTGVDVSGSSKSANVSETFVVSFPLVRRAVTPAYDESHGADLQFSVANTNAKALLASSRLLDSNATLTFHFGPHLTLGAVGDTRHLTNLLTPASDSTRSSLRIDVGMTY